MPTTRTHCREQEAGKRMIAGILLAAGAATRFGGNKLIAPLPDGRPIAQFACTNLRPAVDRLIAVVPPDAFKLAATLSAAGAEVVICDTAHTGMGASLAYAISCAADADGWVIALADMPLIAPETVRRVADALRTGAAIVVPEHHGRRGHPVGFSRQFSAELLALGGDSGARTIIADHADKVLHLPVDDAGCLVDIDTREDLAAASAALTRRAPP